MFAGFSDAKSKLQKARCPRHTASQQAVPVPEAVCSLPSVLPRATGPELRLPSTQASVRPVGPHAFLCDFRRTFLKNIYKNSFSVKACCPGLSKERHPYLTQWLFGHQGPLAMPRGSQLCPPGGTCGSQLGQQSLPKLRDTRVCVYTSGLCPLGPDSDWSLITAVGFCLD